MLNRSTVQDVLIYFELGFLISVKSQSDFFYIILIYFSLLVLLFYYGDTIIRLTNVYKN